ncbi:hypothetical protein R75461_02468 [Paraburkholderia nemoris]|nr:hypothetical protein R75461_02468 [Paraburkholderia nemoris]
MVRIASFVAVVGLMLKEAALLQIDVVAIRHLQSMILAFGLPDRLTLVAGNRASKQAQRTFERPPERAVERPKVAACCLTAIGGTRP